MDITADRPVIRPVASFYVSGLNAVVKTGGRPSVMGRPHLRLENYLLRTLPAAPPSADYYTAVQSWPDYGNVGWPGEIACGDCTVAASAYAVGCWTANEAGQEVTFARDQVIGIYSQLSGYNPSAPLVPCQDDPQQMCNPTDVGVTISDMLDYAVATGFPGNHKVYAGYVSVDPQDQDAMKWATYWFGALNLAVRLPPSWQAAVSPGFVWDVDQLAQNPPLHTILVVGYDQSGLNIITWQTRGTLTWAALSHSELVYEAWASISYDWVTGNKPAPNGLALSQLSADLQSISKPVAMEMYRRITAKAKPR